MSSNEPIHEDAPKGRSRSGSLVSLDGQPPERRQASGLGEQQPKRSQSYLERIGVTGSGMHPDRSPAGAIRTASGLTIRPPAQKPAGEAGAGAAFTEIEIDDEGTQWHALPLDDLFAELKSTPNGLSSEGAKASQATWGLNMITPPKKMHPLLKFLLSLVHGFQLMMNVGAILCFIVYGISNAEDSQTLALGVMLIVVVFLTSAFQTYQEGKADKIMEELRALVADAVYVYRDGEITQVPADQITVGDIVQVKAGEKVPADLRILTAQDLKVNNASLTGENVDIKLGPNANHKRLYEAQNIARSGCNFTCGTGTGIVFATGDHTFFGQIAKSTVDVERPDSLMKMEIDRMIMILSVLAVILGIAFGIIAIFFNFTWVQAVAFAIGIIVANVPEGLLSQLVVTLALTAKKLQKYDVLVTALDIIETLGAVSVICSDKTGTLTCNRMTVVHVVYDGVIHTTPQTTDRTTDDFPMYKEEDEGFAMLRRSIALNTDAVFLSNDDGSVEPDVLKRPTKGDASESALIKFIQPFRDIVEHRAANKRVAAIPFNSSNKWMLSVNANEEAGKPVQVMIKGAPERVLDMCATARVDGKVVDMNEEVRQKFEDINLQLGSRGERVLGFASLDLDVATYTAEYPFDTDSEIPNFPMSGLTFLGFVALIDPPRDGVPQAVADCMRAGIKVFMVTGDHPVTALAIARSIGISTKDTANEMRSRGEEVPEDYHGCIAVHGSEMTKFEEEDWDRVLAHDEIVFARTMPQQKQDIVENLKRLDYVVAMTGDGVNDAPALKAANVGVAMGSGTSVAKEAAQIVVMKDDFGSIVTGIRAGRLVFATLKKVITYVLVSNTPQILPFLFFVAAGIPLAIETIVILTIDLGTDILPAIAMAYEAEEDETMSKPPRGRDDHLVSIKMIGVTYATVGLMHTLVSYFGFFYVLIDLGFPLDKLFGAGLGFREGWDDLDGDRKRYMVEMCLDMPKYIEGKNLTDTHVCAYQFDNYRAHALAQAQAAFFIAIIWGQIANIFIRKTFTETILKVYRFTNNPQVMGAICVELALAMALIYLPGLNEIFLMTAIKAEYLFITIWYIPVLIFYDEVRKFFVRNWPDGLCAAVTHF